MLVNHKIGFMQGRLTEKGGFFPQQFPWNAWQDEFYLGAEMGFDCIEWMFNEEHWQDNPIFLRGEPERLMALSEESGVQISGICANYFMKCSIYDAGRESVHEDILNRLAANAHALGCGSIIIPLFDASEIQEDSAYLYRLADRLSCPDVALLFESDRPLSDLAGWISGFARDNVGICYDIGNAVGMGYDPADELNRYGGIVKNIHIKDKTIGGPTVMLGEGDADFAAYFDTLRRLSYTGCFILESYYREAVEDTRRNFTYIKDCMK